MHPSRTANTKKVRPKNGSNIKNRSSENKTAKGAALSLSDAFVNDPQSLFFDLLPPKNRKNSFLSKTETNFLKVALALVDLVLWVDLGGHVVRSAGRLHRAPSTRAQSIFAADPKNQKLSQILSEVPEDPCKDTLALIQGGWPVRMAPCVLKIDQFHIRCMATGARPPGSRNYILFLMDVDRCQRAEMSAVEALRFQAMTDLAAAFSHQVNNLLQPVISRIQTTARRLPQESVDRESLDSALSDMRVVRDMVREIMKFGRSINSAERSTSELSSTLSRIELFIIPPTAKDIKLHWVVDGGIGHVALTETEISDIMGALCSNAFDSIIDRGSVTVIARRRGGLAEITVEDTGVGLRRQDRVRAFDPFFTTKYGDKHRGLGLSTVYGLVTAAGGRVSLESRPMEGALVRMTLPLKHRDGSPRMKILVVDDMENVRDGLKTMIEDMGHSVDLAENGAQAMEMIRIHPYDMLITDLAMPEINGRTLISWARAQDFKGPILAITGGGMPEDIARHGISATGATACLNKPVFIEELEEFFHQVATDRK